MKDNLLITDINTNRPEDAFAEIYALYSPKVHDLAYKMTGGKQAAEDICQETFIRVFNNLSGFRGESRLFTWIYRIAKNLCLRHLEKNRRRSLAALEGLIEKANLSAEDNLYQQAERRFYVDQVKDGCLLGVLRCLAFNQRLAFILSIFCDLTVREIAGILCKSENSTRILVHRARGNIKKFLCANCSLYDPVNRCRCENLISFSLVQGWIEKYDPPVKPKAVESEIRAVKNEIALYKSIRPREESRNLQAKILTVIRQRKFSIFSGQKVK